jgi:CubicO group peptidase (beta-lactamase class C family)
MPVMIKAFLVTCAAALAPALAAEPPNESVSRKLEQHMELQVRDHRFRGTVLVAQNGRMLLAKGYGFADEEWGALNALHTKFRIGSLTKQFTATLIMQLREQHRLDLQDSICRHLQPCPEEWKAVTLHHLLTHSSGIPGFAKTPAGSSAMPPWTAEQITAEYRGKPLESTPGTQWKYSDWGYSLLGLVIEKISGTSYEQALRTHILDPLGMHDTGYDHTRTILKQRAAGYRLVGNDLVNADYIDMRGPYSAGALYSTASDLYKWDQALYSNTILPRGALEIMWKEHMEKYGLWMVCEQRRGRFEARLVGRAGKVRSRAHRRDQGIFRRISALSAGPYNGHRPVQSRGCRRRGSVSRRHRLWSGIQDAEVMALNGRGTACHPYA